MTDAGAFYNEIAGKLRLLEWPRGLNYLAIVDPSYIPNVDVATRYGSIRLNHDKMALEVVQRR